MIFPIFPFLWILLLLVLKKNVAGLYKFRHFFFVICLWKTNDKRDSCLGERKDMPTPRASHERCSKSKVKRQRISVSRIFIDTILARRFRAFTHILPRWDCWQTLSSSCRWPLCPRGTSTCPAAGRWTRQRARTGCGGPRSLLGSSAKETLVIYVPAACEEARRNVISPWKKQILSIQLQMHTR